MNKIIYLIPLLFLGSCLSEPSAEFVSNFNAELNLSLSQVPTPEGPEVLFVIESVDNFDCNSTVIQSNIALNNGDITLEVSDVLIPDNCSAGDIPARGENNLWLENGDFNFQLNLGKLSEQSGILSITDDSFVLDIENISGVNFTQTEILRIPENHVWGTLEYSEIFNDDVASYVVDISQYVELSNELRTGNYGLFKIQDDQGLETFQDDVYFFIFKLTDIDGLRSSTTDFRTLFPEITLDLTTSRGEKI